MTVKINKLEIENVKRVKAVTIEPTSNGLIVERKGKNSDLKVTDPSGQKAGQQLLDSFVEELALNLPKFIESSAKDKANTLLQIIGVGEKLWELDRKEEQLYNCLLYTS